MKNRKSLSTYLDLVRFSAAALVVLEHSVLLGLLPPMGLLTRLSHEAVVVFFVLSGFVIASSRTAQDGSARDYIVSRAARLYSVALPALVLCYGAFLVTGASAGNVGTRFLSSLFFFDDVWFNYRDVPFNGPYWSLCYEAWYYALWGVICFVRRPHLRWLAAGCVLLAMGPAFATLAGIWLFGAALATQWKKIQAWIATPLATAVLFVGPLLGVAALAQSDIQDEVRLFLVSHIHGWWRMRGAGLMVTDYIIALLVVLHLAAAGAWLGSGRWLHESAAGRAIEYCARFTFALYLFHYPLLLLFKASLVQPVTSPATGLGLVVLTISACWAVSLGTEGQLPRWRRAMKAGLSFGSREAHAPVNATLIRG